MNMQDTPTRNLDPNRSSEEIQRDIDGTRARVSETIGELRDRMAPSRLVDQAVDYARESGATDTAKQIGRTVRENPVPFIMIGAGIGWLLAARYGEPIRHSRAGEAVARKAEQARDGLRVGVDRARDGLQHGWNDARNKVHDGSAALSSQAGSTQASIAERTARWRENARLQAHRASDFAQMRWQYLVTEQPLVLIGLGFTIGAVAAIALPSSTVENRLMGDTSHSLKQQARDTASERLAEVRTVAGDALETAQQKLRDAQAEKPASPVGDSVIPNPGPARMPTGATSG